MYADYSAENQIIISSKLKVIKFLNATKINKKQFQTKKLSLKLKKVKEQNMFAFMFYISVQYFSNLKAIIKSPK